MTRLLLVRHGESEWNAAGRWQGWADPPLSEMGLTQAAELVPMDATGRRTIQMRHPNLGDRMSNTIHMSVQCVLPGEIAKAHRHNAAAATTTITTIAIAIAIHTSCALMRSSSLCMGSRFRSVYVKQVSFRGERIRAGQ